MSAPAHPEVLWAQRSSDVDPNRNIIWVTISVPDLDPTSVKVNWETDSHLKFEGISNPPHMQKGSTASQVESKHFLFDYDLFGPVEEIIEKRRLTNKSLILTLKKKVLDEEYWPRLIKEKKKIQTIKTDFSKWKDQDEQDEDEPEDDTEGMGGAMPGLGGGGAMSQEEIARMMEQYQGAGGPLGGAGGDDDSDEEFEDGEDDEEGEEEEGKKKAKKDDDMPPLE